MILSICSPLSHRQIKKIVFRYFPKQIVENFNDRKNIRDISYTTRELTLGDIKRVNQNTNQVQIIHSWELNKDIHPVKIDFLKKMLISGMGSIFYKKLREELGLFYSAKGEIDKSYDIGVTPSLIIHTKTEEKNIKKYINEVNKLINDFPNLITENDIYTVKNTMLSKELTAESYAKNNIKFINDYLYDIDFTTEKYIKMLESITFEEIIKIARIWIDSKPIIHMLGKFE